MPPKKKTTAAEPEKVDKPAPRRQGAYLCFPWLLLSTERVGWRSLPVTSFMTSNLGGYASFRILPGYYEVARAK
eukprot:scaffold20823_cov101-Skeletonema_dohrnii-CCMP3373.AAC.7